MSVSRAKRLGAVVVTSNRLDQLKVTVTNLLGHAPALLEALIVVDNASTDGTADWLSEIQDDRLKVISLEQNTGGAGGFAVGLKALQGMGCWGVVMDDDARPLSGSLQAFQDMDVEGSDAVGAAVLLPGGAVSDMNRPSINPFGNLPAFLRTAVKGREGFHLQPSAYEPSAPIRSVDVASFVGLFLSPAAILQTPLPDPRLFLYADDALYTLALRKAGGKIAFAPAIRFEHDCRTLGPGRRLTPLWKVYYFTRNQLLMRKAAAGVFFWILLPLLAFGAWRGLSAYEEDRPVAKQLTVLAWRDALSGNLNRTRSDVDQRVSGSSPQAHSGA